MILEYLNKKYVFVDLCWIVQHIFYHMYHRFIVRFPMGVGLPLHSILSSGVLVKEYCNFFSDALSGVNHMRGMQYQIVLNITLIMHFLRTDN